MTPKLLVAAAVAVAIVIGFVLPGPHDHPPMKAQIPIQEVAEG